MKWSIVLVFLLVACNSKPKSMNEVADTIMKEIEVADADGIEEYVSEELLRNDRKKKLDSVIMLFRSDFLKIQTEAERHRNIEYENGQLYRYRYTTDKGTELQLELIFEDQKDKFLVKEFTLIPIDSFTMQRTVQRIPYKIRVK